MRARHIRPPSNRRQKRQRIAVFFLTLTLSLALFSGVAWWLLTPQSLPPVTSPVGEEEAAPPLHLLIALTDQNSATGFLLVMLGTHAVTVTALPYETEVPHGTQYATLGALFDGGTRTGMEAVCAAVSRLCGKAVSKYLVFSTAGVSALLSHLGGALTVDIPEPIRYDGTLPLQLDAGVQTVSSVQVQALLSCPSTLFAGGRAAYASLRATLCAALYNQYAVPRRADAVEEDFKAALQCASAGNLLISDLRAVEERLYALRKRNGGTLCRAVTVAGSFVGRGEDTRFYVDENAFSGGKIS